MFKNKKVRPSVFIFLATLMLSGCFHFRKPSDLPPGLSTLYFTTSNVSSSITAALRRELNAAGVHFTQTPQAAPLTLSLYNSHTHVDLPLAFNSLSATVYTYKMSLQLKLIKNNTQVVLNRPIVVSQDVTHNVNQVDTPVITPLMRRSLTRRLINTIFDVLTSVSTQKKLNQNK